MFCKYIQKNLSAYIDGEVGKIIKYLIEKHILSCKDCNKKLEFFKSVTKLTKKKESFQLSNDFVADLRQKIVKIKLSNEKEIMPALNLKVVISCLGIIFIVISSYFLFKVEPKLEYPMATLSYQTKVENLYLENGISMANIVNQTRRW